MRSHRRGAPAAGQAALEAIGRWTLLTTGVDRPDLVPAVGRAVAAFALLLRAGVVPALAGAVLAWWGPNLARSRRVVGRQAVLDAAVPELAELLHVAVGGGASAQQAITAVAPWAPPPLAPMVADAARRLAAGRPLADVLERLGTGSPALGRLSSEVSLAARTGAPLAPALQRAAEEGRRRARHDTEAAARRLPVVLLFPLTCCILPAFGLLTVGPALAAGLRTLQP